MSVWPGLTPRRGFLHKFAPTDARYVRVTGFGDSTGRQITLVEVRVFEAK